MFIDYTAYSSLERIVNNMSTVRFELSQALRNQSDARSVLKEEMEMDFPSREWAWDNQVNSENLGYDVRDGSYSMLTIFKKHHDVSDISSHFGKTLSLINGVGGVRYAAISALGPKAHIEEHSHNRRHLVFHMLLSDLEGDVCKIICDGNAKELASPGDSALFDYSFPHEIFNYSRNDRINLMIDFKP